MKKNLLMAAFVAAALSACTQNEEIGNAVDSNNGAINFSTYVGKNTRAGVMDETLLKKDGKANGFYVLGYSTGLTDWKTDAATAPALNFMLGDQVYYDGSTSWIYDNIKYWPNEVDGTDLGKVSFFAYAPKVENVVVATPATAISEFPTLTYTCPTVPADQKDVVAANALDKTKTGGTVSFTFGHILSKICFSAKLAANYENATITVTGLNVLYAATMDKTAAYRMDKAAWETASATFGASDEGSVFTDRALELTWNAETTAANVISLNTGADYLMMLPQELSADEFKVELTYTVLDVARGTTITNVVTVNLPAIEWTKGKQYNYVLKVSEDKVVFDNIGVSEWTNYDSDTDNTGNVDAN